MSDVLIIGFGVVGRNLKQELSALNPDICDKYHIQYNSFWDIVYDLAFICVPAPYDKERGARDLTEVKAAIAEHDADLYIIRTCYAKKRGNALFTRRNIAGRRFTTIFNLTLRFLAANAPTV